MVKRELKEISYLYEECYQKKSGNIFFLPTEEILICELTGSFVEFEEFQKLFLKAEKLAKNNIISQLIIDMRSIEGFHQPSFEWLLLIWKADMQREGVSSYKYLLRDETWFEELVRLTFRKAVKTHPQTILAQIEIKYCKSFYEAING